jgi:hypothetical protein
MVAASTMATAAKSTYPAEIQQNQRFCCVADTLAGKIKSHF